MLSEDVEHKIILNRWFELQKPLQCKSKWKYCSCSFIGRAYYASIEKGNEILERRKRDLIIIPLLFIL